ncbi:MAG: hypothetical protein CR962_01085 [Gammaproteobacteria bacterium]|nr:MAG: hypothetical protein CR962_01085 [Gammaproteobacteria bacterium]
MQEQLLNLQDELNKTIVFITHDLSEALRLGTRIAILNDGKLVQIGTPADILLNPVDDYVREFVQDVNRADVITAKRVMQTPQCVLHQQNSSEALTQIKAQMQAQGLTRAWLQTAEGVSVVTKEQLLQASRNHNKAIIDIADIALPLKTLPVNATLEQLIPLAIGNAHPIPLLNDHGDFVGVVEPEQIINILNHK